MGLLFNKKYREGKRKYWRFSIIKKSNGSWAQINTRFEWFVKNKPKALVIMFWKWELQWYQLDLDLITKLNK